MIYLILKIFVYLLLALLAGVGAGWVLRHLSAARQEEEMQRTLADVRARVPQFESLIRTRDEQIGRLREDLKEKDARINALLADLREAENQGRETERELRALQARQETLDEAVPGSPGDDAGQVLVGGEILDIGEDPSPAGGAPRQDEVNAKVAELEAALAQARSQAADAVAEAAAAEAEVITLKAALSRAGRQAPEAGADEGAAALEARLARKTMDYERLARDLEVSQRRVTELERERELQNKSLQVLHQQLELERERGQRVASA